MTPNRIDTLKSFLKDDPEDSFVLFALAKEYEKIGLLKKALEAFIHLKDIDREYIGLYYHLAALYNELNEKVAALETYEEGIELAKKLGDFHALSELANAKTNLEVEA